jgi:hypothetical protein
MYVRITYDTGGTIFVNEVQPKPTSRGVTTGAPPQTAPVAPGSRQYADLIPLWACRYVVINGHCVGLITTSSRSSPIAARQMVQTSCSECPAPPIESSIAAMLHLASHRVVPQGPPRISTTHKILDPPTHRSKPKPVVASHRAVPQCPPRISTTHKSLDPSRPLLIDQNLNQSWIHLGPYSWIKT